MSRVLSNDELSLLSQNFERVNIKDIDMVIGAKTFNRPINERKIRGLIGDFDPQNYSPPILYRLRTGPKLFGVIDGQHTLYVINKITPPDKDIFIYARIVPDTSPKELVARFKKRNTHGSAATETDKFWGDVHAKDKDSLDVKNIIEKYNIPVLRRRPHNVPAIIKTGKLREMYLKYGKDIFDATFEVIYNSFWDKKYVQYKAIENYFILGLLQLVSEYPDIPRNIFLDYSAVEIESMSNRIKVGGHKNKRIYLALKRMYKQLIKEYE